MFKMLLVVLLAVQEINRIVCFICKGKKKKLGEADFLYMY